MLATDGPYFAAWEAEMEARGPVVEAYCPQGRLPDGRGFWEDTVPASWRAEAIMPLFPYIPEAHAAIARARAIVDMGGEPRNKRIVPGATLWTLPKHDMRDVSALAKGSYDLVFSSHSIEHVPPDDVPQMLRDWLDLLRPGGEMFILGPHRCAFDWSPVINDDAYEWHKWAPACATVGNFLVSLGMTLLQFDTHIEGYHIWYVWARKL